MLTQLEERAIWIAICLFLIIGGGLFYTYHERGVGAQKCEMDDAKLAAIQQVAFATQAAKDASILENAEHDLNAERAQNDHLRASQPVSHVVCYAPRPQPMSTPQGVPQAPTTAAGLLPAAGAQAFDPGPGLDELHSYADEIVAQCRAQNEVVNASN